MTIGTVQRVMCIRVFSDGHQATSWTRDMFVPSDDTDDFHKQFTAPVGSTFVYNVAQVQVCFRKPRNIPHWRE